MLDDDATLMFAYAKGDALAFERLYGRHKQGLYGFIHRQSPRAAWVDDVFQETWLSVVNARHEYQASARFSTWLYGMARNRLIDRIRRHEPSLLGDFVTDEADDPSAQLAAPSQQEPANIIANKQSAAALDAALRALPAVQREVFLLREQAGMSLDEIAALVGVSMETTKSRLRYAIAKLKVILTEGS